MLDFIIVVAFPCAMHANLICLAVQFILRYRCVCPDTKHAALFWMRLTRPFRHISRRLVVLLLLTAGSWWMFEVLVTCITLYQPDSFQQPALLYLNESNWLYSDTMPPHVFGCGLV